MPHRRQLALLPLLALLVLAAVLVAPRRAHADGPAGAWVLARATGPDGAPLEAGARFTEEVTELQAVLPEPVTQHASGSCRIVPVSVADLDQKGPSSSSFFDAQPGQRARCALRWGGLMPIAGTYRAEILQGDAVVATLPFEITAAGALADPAFRPRGENIALDAHGGIVTAVCHESFARDVSPMNLNDGIVQGLHPDRTPSRGWSSGGSGSFPHEVELSFYADRVAWIEAVSLDVTGKDQQTAPAVAARHVEVWVSTAEDPAAGDYTRVGFGRLARRAGDQWIVLQQPVQARRVKLRFLSNWTLSDPTVAVAEVKITEAPGHPSILAGTSARARLSSSAPFFGAQDANALKSIPQARPIALGVATDLATDAAEHWFKIPVPGPAPLVVHVGALNTGAAQLRVYDAKGRELRRRFAVADRPSSWHATLVPGDYYVRLAWNGKNAAPAAGETPPAPGSLEEVGTRPAILVLTDPVEPVPTVRGAAQLGLDYLEVDTPSWQNQAQCNGCHMQAQTLMGMAVARRNHYRVADRAALALGEFLATHAFKDADRYQLYRQVALRYYVADFNPARRPILDLLARQMLADRRDLTFPWAKRLPVEAGPLTAGANAIQVLAELGRAGDRTGRALYQAAVAGALARLDPLKPETVQDHVMRIIASVEAGRTASSLPADVQAILALQNPDGGFGEGLSSERSGSNAYGTGQALYGLKLAGFPTTRPEFMKAVGWLIDHQHPDGGFPLLSTACHVDVAHTMWAVIGLAGSFDRAGTDDPFTSEQSSDSSHGGDRGDGEGGGAGDAEGTGRGHLEHRLSISAGLTPLAVVTASGDDGHLIDAKSGLLQMGVNVVYGLRLGHLEIGAGVGYRYLHGTGEGLPRNYGHDLVIPLHAGGVVPIGERVELLFAGQVGFTHLWMPHQGWVEGGDVLRAIGVTLGPQIAAFFTVAPRVDLLMSVEAELAYRRTTNGRDTLRDVPLYELSVPFSVGARARW